MNPSDDVTNLGQGIADHAVSLYGQDDAMEDFPVLKAFQQYIDAEQAKARKRMIMLCAFFGMLMTIVITVFVILLFNVSTHNQALNDRLIDFAMKERMVQPSGSAVVVQPPQDNAALLKLTEKLNEMQKKLSESEQAVAAAEAKADEASRPKGPTPEEKEILRLKALLNSEKEKVALEKEKLHQAELEAYRRKYYPELYEKPVRRKTKARQLIEDEEEADREIEEILKDGEAISYYDEDEGEELEKPRPLKKRKSPSRSPVAEPGQKKEKNYSIPVDIKGSSSNWNIPMD